MIVCSEITFNRTRIRLVFTDLARAIDHLHQY